MNRYHVIFILADMPARFYDVYDRETAIQRRVELSPREVEINAIRQVPQAMIDAARAFEIAKQAADQQWLDARGLADNHRGSATN